MSGRIQTAVLLALLALGGSGLNQAVTAILNNSRVLYMLAEYKMFTGDTDMAIRLLRKADMVAPRTTNGPAQSSDSVADNQPSPNEHKG